MKFKQTDQQNTSERQILLVNIQRAFTNIFNPP